MPRPEQIEQAKTPLIKVLEAANAAGVRLDKFENNHRNIGISAGMALAIELLKRGVRFDGQEETPNG